MRWQKIVDVERKRGVGGASCDVGMCGGFDGSANFGVKDDGKFRKVYVEAFAG